jgi:GNAT superfamily N-acetyltransferase
MSEQFIYTSVHDPLARPLFDGLEQEYDSRYADVRRRIGGSAREELERYPAEAFAAPVGAFVLLLRDGEAVSGGAFMPHRDSDTAEFKRIWTLPGLRRQGIARRVLQELEDQAVRQGYRRVFLTTGFRQPEAVGLYLSHGYRALFDLQADPETVAHLPFEKHLPTLRPVTAAAATVALHGASA